MFITMTMTKTACLDGKLFAELLRGGFANLCAHEDIVNDLNVFPIPDGDTGNNMRLTVEGGIAALDSADAHTDSLAELAHAVSDGALLTARGNSGVILSQLIAGFAEGLNGHNEADSRVLAQAAISGVQKAYASVITPVEGTVLTVAREAAEALAQQTENKDLSLEEALTLVSEEMHASLQRTPDLLPTLKEAGVIDSGGAGLVYLIDGMEQTLSGDAVPEQPVQAKSASAPVALDFSGFTEDSELIYGYCTEFLLRLQSRKIRIEEFSVDRLIERLSPLGDSIVAFQNGTIVKVHIHTKTPGLVLGLCQEFGEFLTMKIENMSLQHSESTVENRFEQPKKIEKKPFGVVAVASGDGIGKLFRQFGADAIVEGGQTMNPSAQDFLNAFRTVAAQTIIVMPNNQNVLLAAKQAAELYRDADVRVLETTTLGEGYQALTMLDFTSGNADTVMENLQQVIADVTTAAVSQASRDASLCGMEIHKGEYLGFVGKTAYAHAPDRVTAACSLLEQLVTRDTEVLVVLIGKDASGQDMEKLRAFIQKTMPHIELYELDGGQAVYDFLFVL